MNIVISVAEGVEHLTEPVKCRLEEIMTACDHIFIGDGAGGESEIQEYLHEKAYENVTVFFYGFGEAQNNAGSWETKSICRSTSERVGDRLMGFRWLVRESDAGLVIWNGKCKFSFSNILEFCEHEKEAYVFWEGKFKKIISFDDVRSLLPEKKNACKANAVPDDVIEKIIIGVVKSIDIRNTIMLQKDTKERMSRCHLTDIVLKAPVSLHKKLEYLEMLAEHEYFFHDLIDFTEWDVRSREKRNKERFQRVGLGLIQSYEYALEHSAGEYIKRIREALSKKNGSDNAVYTLQKVFYMEFEYDKSISHGKSGERLFTSFEAAMEHLHKEMEEWDDEKGGQWFIIKKWITGDNGAMDIEYKYYVINGEIIYFDHYLKKDEWLEESSYYEHGIYSGNYRNRKEADLPVDFKLGDIVTVDQSPFARARTGVVLETGWFFTVLFRDDEGKYHVKRPRQLNCAPGMVYSCLYNMERTEHLHEKDRFLKWVADDIKRQKGKEAETGMMFASGIRGIEAVNHKGATQKDILFVHHLMMYEAVKVTEPRDYEE